MALSSILVVGVIGEFSILMLLSLLSRKNPRCIVNMLGENVLTWTLQSNRRILLSVCRKIVMTGKLFVQISVIFNGNDLRYIGSLNMKVLNI